jgi:hypothetical protein
MKLDVARFGDDATRGVEEPDAELLNVRGL